MNTTTAARDHTVLPSRLLSLTLVFLLASVLLFISMPAMPGTYDEGIMLTGALRTMAGQMPHQDFYVNYGPLAYYANGWLFRVFGVSILAERILFTVLCGLIVTIIYGITIGYCGKTVARWSAITIFLWLFGLCAVSGSAMYPVSLLNLLCVSLVLSIYVKGLSPSVLLATGVLTGISELIRYDTGVALLGVVTLTLAFGIFLREPSNQKRLREFATALAVYFAGFAVVVVPALLYYLSRGGHFQYFVRDIIVYPSKYYKRARSLPFPGIHLKSLDNIAVYLPLLFALMALYIGVRGCFALRAREEKTPTADGMKWHALLATFGLLACVMYLKGLVRASPGQMYLSMLPGIVIIAVLYEHRNAFRPLLTSALPWLLALSVCASALEAVRGVHTLHKNHGILPLNMLAETRGKLPPVEQSWCGISSPLTKGICLLPDDDRIQAIEFIRTHTQPADKLFVGVPHHDRIFANDNITYFATERLPVTKWSDFDPLLQNQLPTQKEMVQEFEADPPPYIVLDAEFEKISEPNESAQSSGVTFLDDYLHSHYSLVETYGLMTVYKRIK